MWYSTANTIPDKFSFINYKTHTLQFLSLYNSTGVNYFLLLLGETYYKNNMRWLGAHENLF